MAKQLIKLYLIVNTMLKESEMGLGGQEFFITLWEVRELEVNYRCEDKTARMVLIDIMEQEKYDWPGKNTP